MKTVKKISKIVFISFFIISAITILSFVSYYHLVTHGVSLNKEKLESSKSNLSLEIYDKNGSIISPNKNQYIKINKLNKKTTAAFISTEDKRFYNHKGIDYIRIGGALLSNIKSKNFSEGASTISQQLIKNTMLTNEKTINRKLKEFKLARSLEKEYSKNDILEMYLNNIYFGNGTYGIETAANYYFNKSAADLTIAESALLAATINAPTIYNIQKHTDKVIERRNLILELMKNQNKISSEEYTAAITEPVNLDITKQTSNNYVYNEIISEACNHLNINENELKYGNYKIYTGYNPDIKDFISNTIESNYEEIKNKNTAAIILNNKTGLIEGLYGTSQTIESKKQPGSTIKPLLVYAPAIEKNIISPATKINDEKINISGYSPENADGKYHGFVSVRESIKNSYNIPAVKLLNELGVNEAKEFAKKLNIEFHNNDNNLALALGGFTEGLTLNQIASAYSAFANSGNFKPTAYIQKITKDNKTIYENNPKTIKAMSDSTAYLITDMLIDTAKSGTAKKLADLNFQVAAKTGTVGKQNSTKNTDAFSVAYTTNHTVITYIGGDNLNKNINGSTYPTMLNKSILQMLYKSQKPEDFKKPSSVETKTITKSDYQNNEIYLSDSDDGINEIFSKQNLPKQKNTKPNLNLEVFNFENRKPILSFFTSNNFTYNIKRIQENKEETISSLSPTDELKITKFEDISAKNNEIYEYFVEICEKSTNKIYQTNKIKLKTFN